MNCCAHLILHWHLVHSCCLFLLIFIVNINPYKMLIQRSTEWFCLRVHNLLSYTNQYFLFQFVLLQPMSKTSFQDQCFWSLDHGGQVFLLWIYAFLLPKGDPLELFRGNDNLHNFFPQKKMLETVQKLTQCTWVMNRLQLLIQQTCSQEAAWHLKFLKICGAFIKQYIFKINSTNINRIVLSPICNVLRQGMAILIRKDHCVCGILLQLLYLITN